MKYYIIRNSKGEYLDTTKNYTSVVADAIATMDRSVADAMCSTLEDAIVEEVVIST